MTQENILCDREVTDHPKALFRRATAHAALMNYEAAREDFELCKLANPTMAKDIDRYDCPGYTSIKPTPGHLEEPFGIRLLVNNE